MSDTTSTISESSYDDLILKTPPNQRLHYNTHSPQHIEEDQFENLDMENILQPSPIEYQHNIQEEEPQNNNNSNNKCPAHHTTPQQKRQMKITY